MYMINDDDDNDFLYDDGINAERVTVHSRLIEQSCEAESHSLSLPLSLERWAWYSSMGPKTSPSPRSPS